MTTTNLPGGTTIHAPVAAPVAIPAREGSQPILPQRPTGRSMAAQNPSSLWRSWPMVVIGVAVLAILAAVVIMILPQDRKATRKKIGAPPPAPERMDLDPMPPKSSQITPPTGNDPWAQPDDNLPPPQVPQAPMQPAPQPVPVPDPADPDPNDILGSLGAPLGGTDTTFAMVEHACTYLKKCGGSPVATSFCDQFKVPHQQPTCAEAQKCLETIDALPCSAMTGGGSASDILGVAMGLQACTEAITSC